MKREMAERRVMMPGVLHPSLFFALLISLLECCHGVRRVLPYQCSTLGDAAVVRGVGADRGLRMGHRARLVVWSPARLPELR